MKKAASSFTMWPCTLTDSLGRQVQSKPTKANIFFKQICASHFLNTRSFSHQLRPGWSLWKHNRVWIWSLILMWSNLIKLMTVMIKLNIEQFDEAIWRYVLMWGDGGLKHMEIFISISQKCLTSSFWFLPEISSILLINYSLLIFSFLTD